MSQPSPKRGSARQLCRRSEKSSRRVVAAGLAATDSFGMQAGLSRPNTRSMSNAPRQIRSYAELQEQLHHDLRAQHPEWVDSDGNSPVLDWYDRRLAKVIAIFQSANEEPVNRAAKATIASRDLPSAPNLLVVSKSRRIERIQ
jgi:hypothetical protein